MKVLDNGLKLYLKEVVIHINEYESELNELSQLTTLNTRDYRAAERLLQLLAEVSIGLAKHWLKSLKKSQAVMLIKRLFVCMSLLSLTKVNSPNGEKL